MNSHDAIAELLDRLIAREQFHVLFQPVIDLHRQSIDGYEGLIRGPANGPLHQPEALFAAAARHQRLIDLDFLCQKLIIRQCAALKLPGRLFLNASFETLAHPDFAKGRTLGYLRDHAIATGRVVIDIIDAHRIEDPQAFQKTLRQHRKTGFNLALSDVGTGYSGLTLWSELQPDFIKLDRRFIEGVDEDQTKRQFVRSLREIAESLNSRIIAEGIERRNEYAALRKLGVSLAQGFYFGFPEAAPARELSPRLFRTRLRSEGSAHPATVAALLKEEPTASPHVSVQTIGEMFCDQTDLRSIALVENGIALGLIPRDEIMNLLASRYGRDLHGRKPIRNFLTRPSVQVELTTPLEEVSRILTNAANLYTDEFILTDAGHYAGKASLMDLLRAITDLRVNQARYANPLTLLPGNVLIQQKLDEWLNGHEPFRVAYCDLDHFKPYNDVYGYTRGDEVIRLIGRLLGEFSDPQRDFVGHIGGDDFIVLFRSPEWEHRCRTLLRTLDAIIPEYYSAGDRENGGIDAVDRYGQPRHFPFVALSIGVVSVTPGRGNGLTSEFIAHWATTAKCEAKRRPGNTLYIDPENPCPAPDGAAGGVLVPAAGESSPA